MIDYNGINPGDGPNTFLKYYATLFLCLLILQNTGWIYGPTIDGHFLPKNVKNILDSQQFNKVPLMNGVNSDECGWLMTVVSESIHFLNIL